MIIGRESPFRRLRADLQPDQAAFLDGVRIAAEMLDVAYGRLSELLWAATQSFDDKDLAVPTAPILLDAWAIVDAVHRLRLLLDHTPGLKKSDSSYKLFIRKTKAATQFRGTIQHLNEWLQNMAANGWPVWGTIAWVAVADPQTRILHSCVLVSGRVQPGTRDMINPAGKTVVRHVDHVTLHCRDQEICLTDMRNEVETIVRAIEPSLAEHTENHPTLAADIFVRVTLRPR
ncbi:hypothetical protein FJY69_04385 [candidate division WOR-3 bacterium]|uniref:Uncharacterized protein n=1 Tax=Eiseniibacteriota bacterium TaxID=2212470 RepID=A0A937X819_UNCEI|nr:hypothetical protein [Candidatus Eisenbacteria bacterium]MBM3322696.1 hypothetical protein [candidate division WOR-3 bacterium]